VVPCCILAWQDPDGAQTPGLQGQQKWGMGVVKLVWVIQCKLRLLLSRLNRTIFSLLPATCLAESNSFEQPL